MKWKLLWDLGLSDVDPCLVNSLLFKGLNIRIPIIIPIKGEGV